MEIIGSSPVVVLILLFFIFLLLFAFNGFFDCRYWIMGNVIQGSATLIKCYLKIIDLLANFFFCILFTIFNLAHFCHIYLFF